MDTNNFNATARREDDIGFPLTPGFSRVAGAERIEALQRFFPRRQNRWNGFDPPCGLNNAKAGC
jgi:hypothetical protein